MRVPVHFLNFPRICLVTGDIAVLGNLTKATVIRMNDTKVHGKFLGKYAFGPVHPEENSTNSQQVSAQVSVKLARDLEHNPTTRFYIERSS